jgi:hypothetical protein
VTIGDQCYDFFPTRISNTIPRRLLLLAGDNTTTITRHHCHHFPTLSLEHLSLSLESNLALHFLHTLSYILST